MKVVLDTNVLISVLLFKGKLSVMFDLIEAGDITQCFDPFTLQEFRNILQREKFQKNLKDLRLTADEIIKAVLVKSLFYPAPRKIISAIKEDPPDNYILACALTARVPFIISGDKHLLKLKKFQNIPIISPDRFLKKFKSV